MTRGFQCGCLELWRALGLPLPRRRQRLTKSSLRGAKDGSLQLRCLFQAFHKAICWVMKLLRLLNLATLASMALY